MYVHSKSGISGNRRHCHRRGPLRGPDAWHYALAGRLDRSVVLGGMLGGLLSICNFFFMAVGASLAADRAEQQNVKGGTALVRMSFLLRYLVLFLILFAAAKSKRFDLLALVLPLVFVRPILMLGEFFRKSGEKRS